MNNNALLEVEDLSVEFRSGQETVRAVNGVSYTVAAGEALSVLGESGSGKTVSAMAVMRLLQSPPATIKAKEITFNGSDIFHLPKEAWRHFSGEKIAMIFQDALASLNPVFSVGWQIAEVFRIHRRMGRAAAERRAIELLNRVGIPEAHHRVKDYPHQFSGGMRQRVMIAMAIALEPELLIADEPTTALDVTVQAQIMDLLAELRKETGMALVLITHDLGVVAESADRVAVMYAGRIVETGSVKDVLIDPVHPYTQGLLHSMPQTRRRGAPLQPIFGSPPNLARIPPGCAFHPRCPEADDTCRRVPPTLKKVGSAHFAECHRIDDVNDG